MAQVQPAQRHSARDWPFEVTPLHSGFGVEITGVSLAEAVDRRIFSKVYEAFLDHQLILFRDVDLPPPPRSRSRGASAKSRFTS